MNAERRRLATFPRLALLREISLVVRHWAVTLAIGAEAIGLIVDRF